METKVKGSLIHLGVDKLLPSPWNRVTDGNGEMKELVDSIKSHGILQPLIVRAQKGIWEIVAGHRRWHAAVKAGMKDVPCIVTELSDQDAKIAQITENLQRKNLTPIEEAHAFQTLMEGNAHTVQTVSDLAGKNVKYVYRSLELLKLPKPAVQAIEKGLLTAAHGHQLARVGPKQIDMVIRYALEKDYHHNLPTVEDLKTFIGQKVGKALSSAPFPTDCEFAGKIACTKCPYNSGNQDVLFEGAQDGHCTNVACFNAKVGQVLKNLQEEGQKKYPSLKFIGAGKAGYGSGPYVIRGLAVVEPNAKVKEAMEKTPEKFGFAILRPNSSWGTGGRKMKLVLVTRDMKLAGVKRDTQDRGGYVEPSPAERAKQEFVRQFVNREKGRLVFAEASFDEAVWRKIIARHAENWELRRNQEWHQAAGMDVTKPMAPQIAKLPKATAELLAWLLLVADDDACMHIVLDQNEINLQKHEKGWIAACQKEWDARKDEIIALYTEQQKRS